MADGPDGTGGAAPGGPGRTSAGLVCGWVITVLGALVTLGAIGVSLYVILSAETTMQFTALLVSAFFFAAFPVLTGLALMVWGRRLVMRSRSGGRPG